MPLGAHIERRRTASALRWLLRHWTAVTVARRLRVLPRTVAANAARSEVSAYLYARWLASTPGAAWCRALVAEARRGRADAAMERSQERMG